MMKRSEYYKIIAEIRKESIPTSFNEGPYERINWDNLADRLGIPPLEDELRRTGRSTALAFTYIGKALAHLEEEVIVEDHLGTREADKMLLETIRKILEQTKLSGWKIDWDRLTLTFYLGGFKK